MPVFSTGLGIESIMIWANGLTSLWPLFTRVKKEVITVLPRRLLGVSNKIEHMITLAQFLISVMHSVNVYYCYY